MKITIEVVNANATSMQVECPQCKECICVTRRFKSDADDARDATVVLADHYCYCPHGKRG